jgi:hypothetical protein
MTNFNDDAWNSYERVDIAAVVARLDGPKMSMKEAGEWLKSNTLTEVQREVIAALHPVANWIAWEVANKRRLDHEDANDAAQHSLILAVVAGGDDIQKKIRNGLREIARKKKQDRETFTPHREETERPRAAGLLSELTEAAPKPHVTSSPPMEDDEWDALSKKMQLRLQRVSATGRWKAETPEAAKLAQSDRERHAFNSIVGELEGPEEKNVVRVLISGESLDAAAQMVGWSRDRLMDFVRGLAV